MRHGRRHGTGAPDAVRAARARGGRADSARARSASGCCSSCPSAARRRRARSSPSGRQLVAPRGPEDGFDERGWLARRGVHVVLRGGDWRIVGRRGGLGGVADRLRAHLARAIAPGLDGERRALLAGIVLGEDEGLSEELRDNFKASGLYHLLAVSRTERRVLGGAVLVLAWLLGIPRLAAQVAALVAIGAYVLAVGWQPSVVRAGVAGALASLAWLALAAARPLALPRARRGGPPRLDPGEPARAGLPALVRGGRRDLRRSCPALRSALEGYPFPARVARRARRLDRLRCGDGADPLAPVRRGARLLAARERARVRRDRAAARARARRRARRAARCRRPRVALAWLNGWLAAYVAACAPARRRLPFAAGRIGAGRGRRCSERRVAAPSLRPAAALAPPLGRARLRRVRSSPCAARVAALAGEPLPPPTGLRITLLDVGQGDSILAPGARGRGARRPGPARGACRAAASRPRVRRLAALVLTHPQRDHIGGAEQVLRAHRRRARARPAARGLEPVRGRCAREAAARRVARSSRCAPARRGRSGACGSARSGRTGPGSPARTRTSWRSSLLASYGEVDVLLTADAETDVTAPLYAPPDRDPQGRAPRLRRSGSRGRAPASCGPPSRSSPAAATTTTATRARPRSPPSTPRPASSSSAPTRTAASSLESDGRARRVSGRSVEYRDAAMADTPDAQARLPAHRQRPAQDRDGARAPPRALRAGGGRARSRRRTSPATTPPRTATPAACSATPGSSSSTASTAAQRRGPARATAGRPPT